MAAVGEASAASVEVDASWESDALILRVSGELDLASVDRARSAIEAAIKEAPDRVVFDLSGLEFMDSSGISLFLTVAACVPLVETRNPTPIVRQLVEMTGLGETLRLT